MGDEADKIRGLLALTLWPEWLPAFRYMGKGIENRSWAPPRRLVGHILALHAGAAVGGGVWGRRVWMERMAEQEGFYARIERGESGPVLRWCPIDADLVPEEVCPIILGAVVCTARLVDVTIDRSPLGGLVDHDGGICGVRVEAGEPWAIPGSVHWRFEDFRWLEHPVPMKGRQGLWRVS